MAARHFTISEARAAVLVIRPLIAEILGIREKVLARAPELWPAMERSAGDGGSEELSRLAQDFTRLDTLVHMILKTGVEIKDLGTGLVDFRCWRRDQEVYLCWKFDEEDIRFWHELDAGFAGRKPIEQF